MKFGIYAHKLCFYPLQNLDELCLSGFSDRKLAAELCASELGRAFKRFADTTLSLKYIHFSIDELQILLRISRKSVTKLNLVEWKMYFNRDLMDEWFLQMVPENIFGFQLPLCPEVKVINYSITPSSTWDDNMGSIMGSIEMFVKNATEIQHVGLDYGYQPVLDER